MLLASIAIGVVIVALLWDLVLPSLKEAFERHRARRALIPGSAYDPGRERRAEQRARQLLQSCVNEEEWSMYRDLGFIRVWGGMARVPRRARIGDDPRPRAPPAPPPHPPQPHTAHPPPPPRPPHTDRRLPPADPGATQRVLRRVPRRDAALWQLAPPGLRRRAREVDGPHRGRGAPPPPRKHHPAGA